ncbi:MAG: ABC transporter permease [Chloroflexota bacterium]
MTTERLSTGIRWGEVLRQSIVFIVLLALILLFATLSERFLQPRNLTNILQQNVHIIIVTIGVTLTMLVGGIDLSVGSVAALAGAVSAGLIVNNGIPFWPSVIITLAMGFVIGGVNGGLIVWGKLPPFVATLAMLGIARGLTLLYTQGRPISGMGDAYTFWGRGDVPLPLIGEVPAPIVVAIVVIIVFALLMNYTRYGLHVYAVGGNEDTARLAGIPVNRVKIITYGLSGLLAALAGMLLTARLFSAQPQTGVGLELQAIAASVLGGVSLFGGVGNVLSAVIGGLLIGVLANGMNLLRVASYQQQMIEGGVLVLAVAVDTISRRFQRQ